MEERINYSEILGISKQWLNEMFPFHFVLDEWGGISDCGELFQKAVKDLEWDMAIDNYFEYEVVEDDEEHTGEKEITTENLVAKNGKKIDLVGKMLPLKLRGTIKYFESKKAVLFLGSPNITKANQLTRYGIKISDLPLSDPTRNYLELIQEHEQE